MQNNNATFHATKKVKADIRDLKTQMGSVIFKLDKLLAPAAAAAHDPKGPTEDDEAWCRRHLPFKNHDDLLRDLQKNEIKDRIMRQMYKEHKDPEKFTGDFVNSLMEPWLRRVMHPVPDHL